MSTSIPLEAKSSLKLQSTPTRDRDRLPFPQAANPSPGPSLRLPTNSSNTSHSMATPPKISSSHQPLTVESVLKQFATKPDPKAAALDHVVADRNVLSAQNAQLWKLIEKQRAGYNQILKELERIRGERDSYKSKIVAMTGSASGNGEKRYKSGDRNTRPSLDSDISHSSSFGGSSSSHLNTHRYFSDASSTHKNLPHLHLSRSQEPLNARNNENGTASANSATNTSPSSPQLPPPPLSAPSSILPETPNSRTQGSAQTIVLSPRSSAMSNLPNQDDITQVRNDSGSSTTGSNKSGAGINAIPASRPVVYPRKASLAESVNSVMTTGSSMSVSTPASPTSTQINHNCNPQSVSQQPLHTGSQNSQSLLTGVSSSTSDMSNPNLRQGTLTTSLQSNAIPSSEISPHTTSSSQNHNQPQFLSPILESRKNMLSRDSHVSIPDEAKRYIANMGESPMSSPQVEAFVRSQFKPSSSITLPYINTPDVDPKENEFLDMGEDDDTNDEEDLYNDDSEGYAQDQESTLLHDQKVGANNQGFDHGTGFKASDGDILGAGDQITNETKQHNSHNRLSSHSHRNATDQTSGQARKLRKEEARAAVDDFPLPPSVDIHSQRQQAMPVQEPRLEKSKQPPLVTQPFTPSSKYSQAMYEQQSPSSSSVILTSDTNTLFSESTYISRSGMSSSSTVPGVSDNWQEDPQPYRSEPHHLETEPILKQGSYRALPLLPRDLPHTRIVVSHSFVRPNERGKEVLSFVISVNPGVGKEGWRVEKMYSDVLNLDQRVRSSVGKGVGKKIANLPEGKLWRDHAPAKVDQRKAVLEHYLQTLIDLPIKNNDEVIAFFTSDIAKEAMQPVMKAGHKEGYLTKRGKNFGGWKTRYFVLQGPVLEYYDCRGGAHLGSITVTGAQIGRQQQQQPKSDRAPSADEEKEYRHAFLIVEAKRAQGGNHPRHVLCAESDEDRDSWVEMLVRYFTGTYSEEPINYGFGSNSSLSRASTSSNDVLATTPRKQPHRGMSKDDISISKGAAVPISSLNPDASNAKLFQTPPVSLDDHTSAPSPSKSIEPSLGSNSSPIDSQNQNQNSNQNLNQNTRRLTERNHGLPSSLPDSSPLAGVQTFSLEGSGVNQRASSELGHYSDLHDARLANSGNRSQQQLYSPEKHRAREPHDGRRSFYPTLNPVTSPPAAIPPERVPSPEKHDANGKVKISGPLNGTPIPSGFKFGGKDAPSADVMNDRREKAKSRSFWGFGKANGDKNSLVVNASRYVFGVPLDYALEVAQICNLPAVVFRAIQYLEAKKADQEEGIYRLSGSSAVVKGLKDRFNNEGDVDLLASDEYWDPHAIAGLLKSFLRELPASILTKELHLKFMAVIDLVDAQDRIRELSHLIAALPLANYSLLRALTAHLILIVQNSSVNKMTMRNVGIVFSPTLGIPAGVFSLMLGEFNRVFNVNAEQEDDPSLVAKLDENMLSDHTSDAFRRNSRQYSDGAADQFLGLSGRTLSASAEELQSEGDDSSLQEESGTETTEGDATVESMSSLSPISGTPQIEYTGVGTPPDTPVATNQSKASSTAASRGLTVAVSRSDRGNRHSRMIGLPSSPRPTYSPSPEVPTSSTPRFRKD